LTSNYDGIWRNYLLATYDGVKWFFTGYDMDVVLGLRAMGRYFYPANHDAASFEAVAGMHKLFELIWKYMRPQLRARYKELRESVLSVENVANLFVDFTADIPLPVYVDDVRRWNTIPSSGANNLAQIITNYDLRCRNADKWIENTVGETDLPEQENSGYTNQVPLSKDTDGTIFGEDYNGDGVNDGYIAKTRLSSSGATKESNYTSTTGYIPATSGAVIRIKGGGWSNAGNCYVCSYKSDFSFIAAVNRDGAYGGGTVTWDGEVAVVTLPDNNDIAYVRVSASHDTVGTSSNGPGSYLIVTVNQEIS
jgi:hypothetical protein